MKITRVTNNGSDNDPFGYVYFDDAVRVIFDHGIVTSWSVEMLDREYGTVRHCVAAVDELQAMFPSLMWSYVL